MGISSVRTLASLSVIVAFVLALLTTGPSGGAAWAQRGPSLIRDAEVERIIRSYANPLLTAAGVPVDAVTIRILNDSSLNAFVTTSNRLFIHSGLLMRADTPDQLTGVIAHEIGHIAGGHVARLGDEIERATITSLAAMALGAAAGMASGRGDVGMAAMSLGQHAATRNFFAFTRTQESAADQFALRILDQTGQSARGLLEFFDILGDQEILVTSSQDPYVRTHPLTSERVATVRRHVDAERPVAEGAPTPRQLTHDRLVAKLFAFLEPQARTLQRYPEGNDSVAARYARAIAYFRRGDLTRARPLIDSLLAESPQDPFFHELKGQMLLENSRIPEAREAYEQAVALAPDEPLITLSLAHALVESGRPEDLKRAEAVLRRTLNQEPRNSFAWRLMGMSQGRRGMEGHAAYAMAEYALLTGDPAQAAYHVGKAQRLIPQSDPLWLRLEDLGQEARRAVEKAAENRR